MIHARPISRHVCITVSYVLSVVMSVIPVFQSISPPVVFNNVVHALRTSAHIALTVRSAATPNVDRARASKSCNDLAVSDKHCVVRVVQLWRTSSSLLSWANLICANASSTNASHTLSAMSWQFSIAGAKNFFFEFRYDTNT